MFNITFQYFHLLQRLTKCFSHPAFEWPLALSLYAHTLAPQLCLGSQMLGTMVVSSVTLNIKTTTVLLLSLIGTGGMLSVNDVDITQLQNSNYRGNILYILQLFLSRLLHLCQYRYILTNGIYHPIESILLCIEGSWVVASHSCFPSPGEWSLMLLCLQQLWWWFWWLLLWVFKSTLHLVCLVFLCAPSLELGSFISCLTSAVHVCGCLTWFFFKSFVGSQHCVTYCLSVLSQLTFDSLSHILFCDVRVLAWNQDQDTRCPHSYW